MATLTEVTTIPMVMDRVMECTERVMVWDTEWATEWVMEWAMA